MDVFVDFGVLCVILCAACIGATELVVINKEVQEMLFIPKEMLTSSVSH